MTGEKSEERNRDGSYLISLSLYREGMSAQWAEGKKFFDHVYLKPRETN